MVCKDNGEIKYLNLKRMKQLPGDINYFIFNENSNVKQPLLNQNLKDRASSKIY